MRNFNVIAKGEYKYKQTNEFLTVERYLIVRKKSHRFLLLDMTNRLNEKLTGLTLQIEQFDVRGNKLGVINPEFKSLSIKNGKFIFKEKIELHHSCIDFQVRIVCAQYGNYAYRLGADDVYVTYEKKRKRRPIDTEEIKKEVGEEGVKAASRRFPFPVTVGICAGVVAIASVAVAIAQLNDFKENKNEFFLQNLQYEILDTTDPENSPVNIIGYTGLGGESIVIPSEVEGHPVASVTQDAFKGNSIIKEVKVEKGVELGQGAFFDCDKLEKVTIAGENIVSAWTFYDCDKLETVEISGVSEIGYKAFNSCDALSSVRISNPDPETTLVIGYQAFGDCRDFTDIYIDQYIAYDTNWDFFYGAQTVENLYLKNFNVKAYESEKEAEAKKLNVLFGGDGFDVGVKNLRIGYADDIPANFIKNCEKRLASVQFDSYTGNAIGEYAFHDCKKLENFAMSKSVTTVGAYAFANTAITSFNGGALTSLGESAFAGCNDLVKFNLRETTPLAAIPNKAFSDCYALESIVIPRSVTSIGADAFSDCRALQTVTFSAKSVLTTVGDRVFSECENLREVKLPEGLENISSRMFDSCYNLRYLSIPSTVKADAFMLDSFADCYRLFEIENLSIVSLTAGGVGCEYTLAVYNSKEEPRMERKTLNNFVIAKAGESWYMIEYTGRSGKAATPDKIDGESYSIVPYLFYQDEKLVDVEISSAVSSIGTMAFSESKLKLLTFAEGKTEIALGERAFADCSYLQTADMQQRKCLEIPSSAFTECEKLATVSLPKGLKQIGASAFANCEALTEITIPATVETIGGSAFQECATLTEVSVASGVTEILANAFYQCSALRAVPKFEELQRIEHHAFSGCAKLEKFTLSSEVDVIEENAFEGCKFLHEIENYSDLDLEKDSFDYGGIAYNAIAIHTQKSGKRLQTVEAGDFLLKGNSRLGWTIVDYIGSENKVTLQAIEGITDYAIARYAFEKNSSIRTVVIGNAVKEMRSASFVNLSKLELVRFENPSIEKVVAGTFENCPNLQSVVISVNLKKIESGAFGYVSAVYYEGTQARWSKNQSRYQIDVGMVYIYNDCIHEYGYWHYNDKKEIVTDITEYKNQVLQEPTCTTEGSIKYYCDDCGYERVDTLYPYGHSFIDFQARICTSCNYVENSPLNYYTQSYFESIVEIKNDKKNPFDVFGVYGERISENVTEKGTEATLKMEAKRDIWISFNCVLDSTYGSMSVVCKGKETKITNGKSVQYKLSKGDVIEIKYKRTKATSNKTGASYITNITLWSEN